MARETTSPLSLKQARARPGPDSRVSGSQIKSNQTLFIIIYFIQRGNALLMQCNALNYATWGGGGLSFKRLVCIILTSVECDVFSRYWLLSVWIFCRWLQNMQNMHSAVNNLWPVVVGIIPVVLDQWDLLHLIPRTSASVVSAGFKMRHLVLTALFSFKSHQWIINKTASRFLVLARITERFTNIPLSHPL